MFKCGSFFFFQDLEGELDTERESFNSLTSTGKKLMNNHLESEEDSNMLQRRLEEMNQRWNYLKAKSIAIRYRLINIPSAIDSVRPFATHCMEHNCMKKIR